jgi:hypothetical protein
MSFAAWPGLVPGTSGRLATLSRVGTSQSRHGGDPPLYDIPCRLAGIWRAARPPDADADSVIWRASPFAIGRRQVTVTECNQQTVTDWLQYAHIAESVFIARGC